MNVRLSSSHGNINRAVRDLKCFTCEKVVVGLNTIRQTGQLHTWRRVLLFRPDLSFVKVVDKIR